MRAKEETATDRNGNEEERATSVATRGGNVASGGKETAAGAVHAGGTGGRASLSPSQDLAAMGSVMGCMIYVAGVWCAHFQQPPSSLPLRERTMTEVH